MTDLIKVNDFAFAYEKNNLLFQHLNFALQAGEILAILGQNGCGKSTLLDLLLGIHRPLQGNIQLNDSIGFVPQFFSAPFAYSVLDIVLMGRSNHIATFSKPKPQDIEVALQALADLQLQHLAEQDFASLSGGQRQLILIARAIASECRLMLLDEPTSALTEKEIDKLFELVNKLRAYAVQDAGLDTLDANLALGLDGDMRDYSQAALILQELGVHEMRLVTNNPAKQEALEGLGLHVTELIPDEIPARVENAHYLQTKRERMRHVLKSA